MEHLYYTTPVKEVIGFYCYITIPLYGCIYDQPDVRTVHNSQEMFD